MIVFKSTTHRMEAVMDRTKLGLVFAKEKPAKRVQTLWASNGTFKIPPQDPNFRVDAPLKYATK